ncbi:MAG: ThuA domain-containing protein [Verrucomicrobiae bacterium]|nr:ThuA domain-containing protein [Verrucomicrobiae bacterium]
MIKAIFSLILGVALAASATADDCRKTIRAVIVTGVDWKGHIWKETAPAVRDILQADSRFQVKIVEDPGFLANDELFKYDVLVLMFKNYDPIPNEEKAKENLVRFVRDGKGLAVIHYASGAFEGWTEFRNLVGRTQGKKHDKRGLFTVRITNPDHPITRGMKDFETDDELFIELRGDAPIEVLATARSNITGQDHPMAFVLSYGKGRVFHTTLGHDERALRLPGPSELIRRGITWAGNQP